MGGYAPVMGYERYGILVLTSSSLAPSTEAFVRLDNDNDDIIQR